MYNEHFKIYFIARFFWKIIKIVIIELYMSILGVIYKNWKQQGRNETNYFMYRWEGPVCSPLPLFTQVQAAPASQLSRCITPHL